MKTKGLVLLLLLTALFLSCKNGKTENVENSESTEAISDAFKVTVNVIAKKNDDFCLLYTEDGSINFKDGSIWQNLKGSDKEQQVVFYLPNGVYPTQFRIDFGLNKEQEDILLKGIIFEYKGKKREIYASEMRLMFRPDESKCTFDGETGIIKALVVDGKKQSPSLYPQESILGPELVKLGKQ